MKFLHLITLASVALAAPNPIARQTSVVDTVNSVVKTLEGSAQSNINTISELHSAALRSDYQECFN